MSAINSASRLALLIGLATGLSACAGRSQPQPATGTTLFVATNGNDSWSGRLPAPNQGHRDGPFLTLTRALQAARENRAPSSVPAKIFVRQGNHFLPQPLLFTSQDSGLQIACYRNEQPILSGGRPISGWKETAVGDRKLWTAEVPKAGGRPWVFRELWVNGHRAIRARHPNKGYLAIESLPDKAADWTKGQSRFTFKPGDLKAWPGITNAEVVAMTRWVESRLPVVNLDENARLISFGKRAVFELASGDPYYVEGALELLDEPGEWFLDSAAERVYYLPRAGESIAEAIAIAPLLSQVVRLEGNPEQGRMIEGIRFSGLTFAHTEWFFPNGFSGAKDKPQVSPAPAPEVGGFSQAAIGVPGAVWGQGVRHCTFERCVFTSLGSYAVELSRGCQSNLISHCEFTDLGAGGLKLGETAVRPLPEDQTRGNQISDCHIHDGGRMFHSAIGIWIGQSPANAVVHNEIHDFYYTGISIGWTWGYGPSSASNNLVAFNHVHHIGVKSNGDGPILSDMGGIYTLGKEPGARILNNLWHDIAGLHYGGWGIYFDEGSSGLRAASNIVYRTTHGGFHQHYGETNMVENNIFTLARDHQLQRTRVEPHPSFTFRTNIVFFDSGALLAGDWGGDQYDMDWNLYFDRRAPADSLQFAGATLDQWRARGHDRNSLIADPQFVAPEKGDFRLQPGSPAFKLGFQPIDLRAIGPRK